MKYLNSPIVITGIVILAAFVLKHQSKPKLAHEIRGVYDEMISIAEDASSSPERTKAVQDFAEQLATQLRDGFSAGFSSNNEEKEKKESRDQKFLRIKQDIKIKDIKEIPSKDNDRQYFLFKVSNESPLPVKSVNVNFDFYRGDELVDIDNDWLSDIQIISSGESFNVKKKRSIPEETEPVDRVEITITSFSIVED